MQIKRMLSQRNLIKQGNEDKKCHFCTFYAWIACKTEKEIAENILFYKFLFQMLPKIPLLIDWLRVSPNRQILSTFLPLN